MLAIFHYGEFTLEKNIGEAKRDYWLMMPMEPLWKMNLHEVDPMSTVEMTKMYFELREPPRLGEPLHYDYSGMG